MQNIDFKAELRDPEAARAQCVLLGATMLGELHQTDTYFKMPDGRLKKREAPGEPTEWIFYHRENNSRPRLSNFTILSDSQARNRWGTQSLRIWVVVKKIRELWMHENVRIHLDRVVLLGWFIEFEALVSEQHDKLNCHRMMSMLRTHFGPVLGEPISTSYSDLIALEDGKQGA